MQFERIHVLRNEKAGKAQDLELPEEWTVWTLGGTLTPSEGAREALRAGADLVVAMGGDGTVNAAARTLVGTQAVLAVVPMGTANVFAAELGLPGDPEAGIALAAGREPSRVRTIDVGEFDGDNIFALRLGIGVEAAMVTNVDPELKQRLGRLAYAVQFWRESRKEKVTRYALMIDGRMRRERGVTCLVCNSANPGLRGISALEGVRVDDGQLDVVVLRRLSLGAIVALVGTALMSVLRGGGWHVDRSVLVRRYPFRTAEIVADPPEQAAYDGEPLDAEYPIRVRVRPASLNVLTPADVSLSK